MKTSLHRCNTCNRYTMGSQCPVCGGDVVPQLPPRYSPEDRWGKYRRLLVKNIREKENGERDNRDN